MPGSLAVYAGLFGIAFAAATVFPLQSEAALVALLLAGGHPVWLLVAVASVGNVLGSVLNWVLGRGIERYRDRPWFPASPAALERAQTGKFDECQSLGTVAGVTTTLHQGDGLVLQQAARAQL